MVSTASMATPLNLDQQFRIALQTGKASLAIASPTSTWHADYPKWRFLSLLQRNSALSVEHGVLIRQAVRWSHGKIFVGNWTPEIASVANQCGVILSPGGDLVASPYRPRWLSEDLWTESQGLDEPPILAVPDEGLPAEPWLWSLAEGRLRSWHSAAQKEACWQALTASPGSTTLLALPTGAGKSLSFQVAARFTAGVTIVVVPTTALAIDQWISAKEILSDFPHLGPRYYSSNDPNSDPAAVRSALQNGSCRLLFASPEACVSGNLRSVIDELARSGRLATLVIDEAHIIDSWGGHFRVEFQLLALRQKQWLAMSGGALRTLLLSATFTPRCLELLRTMFGEDQWRQFSCQRLRPEISYFSSRFETSEDRNSALLDALRHLPRPLILYVTEVEEAIGLSQRLVASGFLSTGCFHGDTTGQDRRKLLLAWRNNDLEIMVATSAFGMGVDKADVRAVLHACYPENVNRYYQEVGRGGRDGAKSIALWMPLVPKDQKVAASLLPRFLGPDLIALRWKTMLDAAQLDEDGILNIPTNAKHHRLMGGRSYNENIRWNKRLLLMMARANLIDLLDMQFTDDHSEPGERVERVRLKCNFVPHDPEIAEFLRIPRERDLKEARQGIAALDQLLAGTAKICRLLRREYGSETIVVCSGCIACRNEPLDRHSVPLLDFDIQGPTNPRIDIVSLEKVSGSVSIAESLADRVADLVTDQKLRHFIFAPDILGSVASALAERLPPSSQHYYRLDLSSEINRVSIDPSSHVVALHGRFPDRALLRLRAGTRISHLFPKDARITDANDRVLLTHDGSVFFPSFNEWVTQI
ncbi:DEAD/DEAH box helicase [Rhizobium sp. CRRU65]|uniref:DEAD/DEAH box helicase n=1 Tax=Rhizobium sp. CRRU65 TaxID=3399566 RepID=UPI003AF8A0BE